MQVELHLLGAPKVKFGDQEIPLQLTKSRLLLIYLAYKGTWVKRQELAGIFYSDDDVQNNRGLRYILYKIKQIPWAQNLKTQDDLIRFDVLTDVLLFKQAVSQGDIENALQIYKGDLLEKFLPDDTPFLEDWLEIERRNLQKIWSESATALVLKWETQGKTAKAFSLIEKVYQINPFAEDVLHIYLRLGYLTDQQQKMIDVYTTFARALRDEFGLEPLEQTKELVKSIRQNTYLSSQSKTVNKIYQQKQLESLIGRELELKKIKESDKPLIIVLGEAGIGKTSLLRTFPSSWLSSFESLSNVAYWPVIEYLQANKQDLDLENYKDDLSRLIPGLFPNYSPTIIDQSITKNRILHMLSAILSRSEYVVFDDIQWLDRFTLELLVYMVKEGRTKLFATCRKAEINQNLTKILNDLEKNDLLETIELMPLSKENVNQLVNQLVKNPSDEFVTWLCDYCGGNPFYIHQIIANLSESGVLNVDTLQGKPKIPHSIASLIQQRVNRLSESTQRVMSIASVLNADFSSEILSSLAGLSEWAVVEALIEAANAGLIRENRFIHGLIKESINHNLSIELKKFIHANIAEKLADKLTEGELAEHWLAAGKRDKACAVWFKMVQDYISNYLPEQSIQILKQIENNIDGDGLVACLLSQAAVFLEYGELKNAENCLSKVGNYQNINDLYCQFVWLKIKINLIYQLNPQEDIKFYLEKAKITFQIINDLGVKVDHIHKIIANYTKNGVTREEVNFLISQGKTAEAIDVLTIELNKLQINLNDKKQGRYLLMRGVSIKEHLAYAYSQLGNYAKAIEITKIILKDIHQPTYFKHRRRITLYNLAIFLIDSNQLDEAIKVIYQARRLARHGVVDYIDHALSIALSSVLIKKRAFKQALKYIQLALPGLEHPRYKLSAYLELFSALAGLNRHDECQIILEEIAPKFLNLENGSYKAMFYALMYRYGSNQQIYLAKKELTKVDYSALPRYAQEYIDELQVVLKINH